MSIEEKINEQSQYLVKVLIETKNSFDFNNAISKIAEFNEMVRSFDDKTRNKKKSFYEVVKNLNYSDDERKIILRNSINEVDNMLNDIWDTYVKEEQLEQNRINKEKREEESMWVEVEGVKYRATKKIDVMWLGWECDSSAWLVEINGEKKIVTTNHGSIEIVNESFLKERIAEYQRLIKDSTDFLNAMV